MRTYTISWNARFKQASVSGLIDYIRADMATMEQIAEEVGGVDLLDPGGPLDQKITDEHILSVSDFMTDWETVASHLGVGDVTVDEIKQNSSSAKKKKEDMLKAWRSKELKNATYRRLGAVFLGLQKTDCTEKILKLALELSGEPII